MRWIRNERGSVTAEFVTAIPAMLMVLMLAITAMMLAAQRVTLTAAAAEVARLEARGDTAAAAARMRALGSGVRVGRSVTDGLLCVRLTAAPAGGVLSAISVSAQGCAAQVME